MQQASYPTWVAPCFLDVSSQNLGRHVRPFFCRRNGAEKQLHEDDVKAPVELAANRSKRADITEAERAMQPIERVLAGSPITVTICRYSSAVQRSIKSVNISGADVETDVIGVDIH